MTIFVYTASLAILLSGGMLTSAWATLGQPAATVERDRAIMKGQRQSRGGTGYTIDTITVAGIEIKEYVSPNGEVFAVVWTGTGVPDLKILLGDYFDEYRDQVAAARKRMPRIREPFRMKSDRLVVERAGHSRSLWGRAYLPSHLPSGIRPEDIQ